MTDARDAILQAHTPALMVPRFGELPPLEKSGHRYLVALDGLWLEVKRPWLSALVPIGFTWGGEGAQRGDHFLPFGELTQRIVYALGNRDVSAVQERFLADALAAMPNEFAAWGVYDEHTGALEYRPLIAIDAAPGGIKFHRPTLAAHEHLAVDLHSHGAMAAFFSETDDADDAGEVKVSMVVGALGTDDGPGWATRLCLLGIFIGDESREDMPTGEATCRKCGCTDAVACPGGCEWVEPDLCSRCA